MVRFTRGMPGLTRYSPLKEITTSNVQNLKPVWSFSTGTLRGHERNPLVLGNVMYAHTSGEERSAS
jgi:lanthanide-dependent methanol dehydrogenase